MTVTFFAGLALGLGMIIPIGAQNVFVFNQGLTVGMPRALWSAMAAGCCDSLLIVLGAAGASALLDRVAGLRIAMLAGGAAFLCYLGVKSLRAKVTSDTDTNAGVRSVRGVVARTVTVSLFNPHALLDTLGVIGAAVAAQQTGRRVAFAAGVLSASWLWFLLLALAAALLRNVLTPARRVWFDRVSGAVLLFFAGLLLFELGRALR
jgi:L-lysine exporter family protein LysE/ArgO